MTKPKTPSTESAVVITATIFPLKEGKRKIVVSGAQEGEMPTVRSGVFAELHDRVDEVWLTLQTRKPQVVRRASGPARTAEKASDDTTPGEADVAAELAGTPEVEKPVGASVLVPADRDAGEPETLDDLPGIQNEQEMNA